MKLYANKDTPFRTPDPVIDDEPDDQRRKLLYGFVHDFMRNEDLYLDGLRRAEEGTPVPNLCNHFVYASMFPDGRVVLDAMDYLLEESEKDHPPQTVITIAEARKLIQDWQAAETEWYAEREAREEATRVAGTSAAESPKG